MCGLDAVAPSLFRIRDASATVNRQPPTAASDGLPVIVACGILEASLFSGLMKGQLQGREQQVLEQGQGLTQQPHRQQRQQLGVPFVISKLLPSSFVSMREHFRDLPKVHQLQVGGSDGCHWKGSWRRRAGGHAPAYNVPIPRVQMAAGGWISLGRFLAWAGGWPRTCL